MVQRKKSISFLNNAIDDVLVDNFLYETKNENTENFYQLQKDKKKNFIFLFKQIKILMWKNLLIIFRQRIRLILELLICIIPFMLILSIRRVKFFAPQVSVAYVLKHDLLVKKSDQAKLLRQRFSDNPFDREKVNKPYMSLSSSSIIFNTFYYYPRSQIIEDLINATLYRMPPSIEVRKVLFLEEKDHEKLKLSEILLKFNKDFDEKFPLSFNYTIIHNFFYSQQNRGGPARYRTHTSGEEACFQPFIDNTLELQFNLWQYHFQRTVIHNVLQLPNNLITNDVRLFYMPCSGKEILNISTLFRKYVTAIFLSLIVISFLGTFIFTLTMMINEKIEKVQLLLNLAGLSNLINWTSYLLRIHITSIVISIIATIVLHIPLPSEPVLNVYIFNDEEKLQLKQISVPLISHVSSLVTFTICAVCSMCNSVYVILFSRLFQKPLIASMFSVGFAALSVAFGYFIDIYDFSPIAIFFISSLLPLTSFIRSMYLVWDYDLNHQSVQLFSRLFFRSPYRRIPINNRDGILLKFDLSILDSIGLLLLGAIIWSIYFFFLLNISKYVSWDVFKKCFNFKKNNSSINFNDIKSTNSRFIESSTANSMKNGTIKIKNISKTFTVDKKEFFALKNVNLTIYQNEVLGLLGSNGAGKTTLSNILIGYITPNEGEIQFGSSSSSSIPSIGFCPQQDVNFPLLTCEEHLRLFGQLQGLEEKYLKRFIYEVLESVNLTKDINVMAKNLSGGMKRRLMLAMTLITNPEIVILDEPTSGLDPRNRRMLWNIIKEIKQERSIIITTHFMDEADILSDRICIMNEGKVCAVGTPLFLKDALSLSYTMNFVVKSNFKRNHFQKEISNILHINSIKFQEKNNEIKLKIETSSRKYLGELLNYLENKKDYLGIRTYDIQSTTLEDVFLHLGTVNDENYSDGLVNTKINHHLERLVEIQKKSHKYFSRCISMLFLKRFYIFRRRLFLLFISIVLPLIISIMVSLYFKEDDISKLLVFQNKLDGKLTNELTKYSLNFYPNYFTSDLNVLSIYMDEGTLCNRSRSKMLNNKKIQNSIPTFQITSLYSKSLTRKGFPSSINSRLVDCEYKDTNSSFFLMNYIKNKRNEFYSNYDNPFLILYDFSSLPKQLGIYTNYEYFGMSTTGIIEYFNSFYRTRLMNKLKVSNISQERKLRRRRLLFNGMNIIKTFILEEPKDILNGKYSWDKYRSKLDHIKNLDEIIGFVVREQNIDKGEYDQPANNKCERYVFFYPLLLTIVISLVPVLFLSINFLSERKSEFKHLQISAIQSTLHKYSKISATFLFYGIQVLIDFLGLFLLFITLFLIYLFVEKEKMKNSEQLEQIPNIPGYNIPMVNNTNQSNVFSEKVWLEENFQSQFVSLLPLYSLQASLRAYVKSYIFQDETFFVIVTVMLSLMINILHYIIIIFGPRNFCGFTVIVELIFPDTIFTDLVLQFTKCRQYAVCRSGKYFTRLLMTQIGQVLITLTLLILIEIRLFSRIRNLFNSKSEIINKRDYRILENDEDVLNETINVANIDTASSIPQSLETFIDFIQKFYLTNVIDREKIKNLFYIPKTMKKETMMMNVEEFMREKKNKIKFPNIRHNNSFDYTFFMQDLVKIYGKKPIVEHLNFSVEKNSCFGLLGVNGAGKSTTFRCIIDKEIASQKHQEIPGKWSNNITYCSQECSVLPYLNVNESLICYLMARGYSYQDAVRLTDAIVNTFQIKQHRFKRVKNLSGGTERKLSTAIAVCGEANLILLDEPTTGLDPLSKRTTWHIVTETKNKFDLGIILTSHSMEECEILCQKIGIMIEGQFVCFGSPQHLKNKHGNCLSITFKLKNQKSKRSSLIQIRQNHDRLLSSIMPILQENFPSIFIKNRYYETIVCQLSNIKFIKLSNVFNVLERLKQKKLIETYWIEQSTLLDIFLDLTTDKTESSLQIASNTYESFLNNDFMGQHILASQILEIKSRIERKIENGLA
ncbi:hypothetical protein SNEBB_011278 [Seison nebaliae]|nr:hypothetical protein SNEBB_011278 [Seison nebaliae]